MNPNEAVRRNSWRYARKSTFTDSICLSIYNKRFQSDVIVSMKRRLNSLRRLKERGSNGGDQEMEVIEGGDGLGEVLLSVVETLDVPKQSNISNHQRKRNGDTYMPLRERDQF
jgi:hypothetical protein